MIQSIAGLSWLGGVIASLVVAAITWFFQYAAKRILIATAMVAALSALTAAFWVAISAALGAISIATPSYFTQAVGLVLPSNTPACFAAIASAHVLKWVYDWQVKLLIATQGGAGK